MLDLIILIVIAAVISSGSEKSFIFYQSIMALVDRNIYSVSELTEKIKSLLEKNYPFIWINGEISNFRVPASGHYYFTLKDDAAQIGAVMFRGQNKRLQFMPEDGMSVTGYGRITVYSPRGAYQMILEYLEPSGIGALQAAFEQLKAKLSEEGLFDETHKKPLPVLPRRVCLITSASGAVAHDIIRVIHRRFPNMPIEIIPVNVQGEWAVDDILAAIELLNSRRDADMAILARGGGSLEDLWPFNSEKMARAIFASEIPIVSAVGHETDYTIADFVADLRAPTPSVAAELAVPVKTELLERTSRLKRQLISDFSGFLNYERRYIRQLNDRLVHPKKKLDDLRLRLDDYCERLHGAFQRAVNRQKERLNWRTDRLCSNSPRILIKSRRDRLSQLNHQLMAAAASHVYTRTLRLKALNGKLHALSPAAVLDRGYSISRRFSDQAILRDASRIPIGEWLEVVLSKGKLTCRVEGKEENAQEDV